MHCIWKYLQMFFAHICNCAYVYVCVYVEVCMLVGDCACLCVPLGNAEKVEVGPGTSGETPRVGIF